MLLIRRKHCDNRGVVNDIRPKAKRSAEHVPKHHVDVVDETPEKDVPFIPPDAVHDNEQETEPKLLTTHSSAKFGKDTKIPKTKITSIKNWRRPFLWLKDKWSGLSKRGKIIAVVIAVLLLASSASAAVVFWPYKKPAPALKPVVVKKIEPPKPTTEAAKLTGLQVPFDVNKRPVVAVMIENSPDARPQSGLLDAGVVFEAVAEGGITRFLTLFQDTQPTYVGPVRSARPYYIRWMLGFDAAYAHAGGSRVAIQDIQRLGGKARDQ